MTTSAASTAVAEQRVLLVDLARRFGGTESRVVHLAASLAAREADVLVVCTRDGMLHGRVRAAGIACAPLGLGRADPRILPRLVRIARRHRSTVVDAHGVHSQFWGVPAALLARVPRIVISVHSEYGPEQAGLRRGRWYERVLRLTRRTRARYVAVSEPVRQYLVRAGVPEERIALVGNAVPPPAVETFGDRAATRRRLGVPDDAFVVTTVARLHPAKGHRHLVDALAGVRVHDPAIHWLVVGDGRLEDELRGQVAAAGLAAHVHFLGFRDDVPALLHASDAFVLPSLTEGLPLVVPEATLHGLPVVASRVGGLPHAYADGELGFVAPGDPRALAELLERLVVDDAFRRSLGRSGQAATASRLSTDAMIDATLVAYAAASRPRGRRNAPDVGDVGDASRRAPSAVLEHQAGHDPVER